MENIKEDYEIIIREINKAREVKDIKFSLNTSQSGTASYVTDNINGELDAIIISSLQNPIQVIISLDGYENIVLFEIGSFSGEQYIPLRVGTVSNKAESFRDAPERWVLNNKLKVEVKGQFNSNVDFDVRYR